MDMLNGRPDRQEEADQLRKENDLFIGLTITFVILFVISSAGAVYFYLKAR